MTVKLIVDQNNGPREVQEESKLHPVLKGVATLLSYIFHPVFVPVYVMIFLLFIQPFLFVGFDDRNRILILIQSVLMFTFFPLVSAGLLKALKFISSVKLKDRKDRIIPFIICNIWYFWIWYVWRNLPHMPREAVAFAMSIFLASSIGLLFNIYLKISMHSIAIGVAVAYLTGLSFRYGIGFGFYLSLAFLIGGAVCTSRLLLKEHHPSEVYWGLATGLLGVIAAHIIT